MSFASGKITDLLLSLTHGQELDLVVTKLDPLSKLHEVTCRVRARAENKHYGRHGRTLFKDCLIADDGRGDVFLTHTLSHKLGDGSVVSVNSETTKQHQSFESL